MPVGALLGGALSGVLTPRAALAICLGCFVIAPLWLWISPIGRVRTVDELSRPELPGAGAAPPAMGVTPVAVGAEPQAVALEGRGEFPRNTVETRHDPLGPQAVGPAAPDAQ
jgi:hypothetical protein